MKKLSLLLSVLALSACGRSPGKLVYEGHELEPRSMIFAHVVTTTPAPFDFVIAVISDRPDACTQYDGLGKVQQPHLGTNLVFRRNKLEKGKQSIPEFGAGWIDIQTIGAISDGATTGTLDVDEASDGAWGGTFDLVLPRGPLKGSFTASACAAMRDYYRDSPEAP